jgi:K+-transporting ATPase KdpF subunit
MAFLHGCRYGAKVCKEIDHVFALPRDTADTFRSGRGPRLFSRACEELVMDIFTWIGLGLAAVLLVYLFFFLFNPERFL